MRFITIFIFFASALADASPKAGLHRRASEIIVEACDKVNTGTDFFGHHFRHMITQKRFRVADIAVEMSNVTKSLVQTFANGAWDIRYGQKEVGPSETKLVVKLR